jgi:DNA-binding winged helix-turn-helix (wHTH) protein
MARLRKALNDDAKNPQLIETIQRKGYRWLKPVKLAETSLLMSKKWPLKSKYFTVLFIVFFLTMALSIPSLLNKNDQEEFLFPDLSIKKLPGGGYEIEAGIEGKLTEDKKAAMLKEIKRITGEENSGMKFTIDPQKINCTDTKKNTHTECSEYQSTKNSDI